VSVVVRTSRSRFTDTNTVNVRLASEVFEPCSTECFRNLSRLRNSIKRSERPDVFPAAALAIASLPGMTTEFCTNFCDRTLRARPPFFLIELGKNLPGEGKIEDLFRGRTVFYF
jgi:hypothetical protein